MGLKGETGRCSANQYAIWKNRVVPTSRILKGKFGRLAGGWQAVCPVMVGAREVAGGKGSN